MTLAVALLVAQAAAAQTTPVELLNNADKHMADMRYESAARTYDQLVVEHPRAKEVQQALETAAALWAAMGKPSESSQRYHLLLKRFPKIQSAPQLSLRLGQQLRKDGDDRAARRLYNRTAKLYKTNPRVVAEALTRLAMLSPEKRRGKLLAKAVAADPKGEFAGEAALELARLAASSFRSIALPSVTNTGRLRRALVKKAEALAKAERLFADVTSYRDRRWSVCAVVGTGRLYADFAAALDAVPTPKALGATQRQMYVRMLSQMLEPIREKGVVALVQAVRTGWNSGALGGCVQDAITRVEALDPTALPPAPADDRLTARLRGKASKVPLGIMRLQTQAAIQKHPTEVAPLFALSMRLLAEGRIGPAAVWLGKAVRNDPKSGKAHLMLGLIRHHRRDLNGALRHFESALTDTRIPFEDAEAIKARLTVIQSRRK